MAFDLWPHQKRGIHDVLEALNSGKRRICLTSPTGGGKCFRRGTEVMLFSGHTIKVEEVVPGMLLMGPDSSPREILALGGGIGDLFEVSQVKGDSYFVNAEHILSVKMTGGKDANGFSHHEVVNISVTDYLLKSNTFKHCAKGYKVAVDFPGQDVPLDPYFFGVWLGDGTSNSVVAVTKPDQEIKDCVLEICDQYGGIFKETTNSSLCPTYSISFKPNGTGHRNPILNSLRSLGVLGNKHLPDCYLINSREVRLAVLAGLLDTDGSLAHSGFDFISRFERLSNGVVFLARSLGFRAKMTPCEKRCTTTDKWGTYYRVSISGDCDLIPTRIPRKISPKRLQKKGPLVTGISVKSIGVGEFFGFQLSGDGLFLLGDFTVTHNSAVISEVIKDRVFNGQKCVLYSSRRLLTEQLIGQLRQDGISFGVRAANHEEHIDDSAPVQICSIQTDNSRVIERRRKAGFLNDELGRRQFPLSPASLVVVDEAHICKGNTAQAILGEHHASGAALLGVTATPLGISHIYDDLIIAGNNSELRGTGALLPCHVYSCPEIDTRKIERVRSQGGEFSLADIRKHCWTQAIYGHVANSLKKNNPDMRPFFLFAPGVEESVGFDKHLNSLGIKVAHIDGEDCVVNGERYKSNRDVRRQILDDVKSGRIFGICNRFVLREAVNVPELFMLVLACPIGSLLSYVQCVGRILRSHDSLSTVCVNDHGANYFRHGSPNADRDDIWRKYFHDPDGETLPTDVRMEELRTGKEECPLCCPSCGSVQLMPKTGRCYKCNHDLRGKRSRFVIQRDGELVEVTGLPVKPRREVKTKDMQDAWSRAFWAAKKPGGKLKDYSFAQLRGMIASGHFGGFEKLRGQFPGEGTKFTPKSAVTWFRKVQDVPMYELYQ